MWIEFQRDEHATLAQWEGFLATARQAGAVDGTTVAEVMADGSTDVLVSWRVEVNRDDSQPPERVSLPTWLVHDLLSVVREVAQERWGCPRPGDWRPSGAPAHL